MYLRVASNSLCSLMTLTVRSSSLRLPSAGITDVYHQALVVRGIKLRALGMLGKHAAGQQDPSPHSVAFSSRMGCNIVGITQAGMFSMKAARRLTAHVRSNQHEGKHSAHPFHPPPGWCFPGQQQLPAFGL